jgi:hypothetical protein
MTIVWRLLGIHKTQIAYRNPEGNAPVERFMRYLNQTLSILLPQYDQWPRILPLILFAYRVLPHSTTRYSPFFLQYGRKPRLPIESSYQIQPEDLAIPDADTVRYAQNMIDVMKETFKQVRHRQNEVSLRNAELTDAHRVAAVDYQINDPVWYYEPGSVLGLVSSTRPTRLDDERSIPSKWKYAWTGPHRITSRTNDKVFRIWHDFRKAFINATSRDLKLYQPFEPLTVPEIVSYRKRRKLLQRTEKIGEDVPPVPRKRKLPKAAARSPSAEPKPRVENALLGPRDIDKLKINELCVVRLRKDEYQPFGIMRYLAQGENGSLTLQYLGNYSLDHRIEVFVKQTFQNSWYQPSTREMYYKQGKLHHLHVPITNAFSKEEVLTSDIVAFPIYLRNNYSLPSHVQKLILAEHAKAFPIS